MTNFDKKIEWSDEDNCYVGALPNFLFGEGKCCHGNTVEDVDKHLDRIIESWQDCDDASFRYGEHYYSLFEDTSGNKITVMGAEDEDSLPYQDEFLRQAQDKEDIKLAEQALKDGEFVSLEEAEKEIFADKVPNATTIKALEETDLKSFDSVDELFDDLFSDDEEDEYS